MLYFRFVYITASWRIVSSEGQELKLKNYYEKTVFLTWHNQIGLVPYMLCKVNKIHVIASSHPDGMIIAWILKFFSIKIIYGSSNRNAFSALKHLIKVLKNKNNIGITPDGPRGPIYKINSNIVSIAKLAEAEIIVAGSYISRHIKLKSWDQFLFPLPFAKAIFVMDDPIKISEETDIIQMNKFLEERLNKMNFIAKNLIKD